MKLGGTVFVLMTGLVGLAAFNSQANLLFWAFGLMVGAVAASLGLSVSMMRGIRVRRLPGEHGAVDEPLPLRYELTNRSWLMPCFGLMLQELDAGADGVLGGTPHGWVLHVGPRSTIQAQATGWPRARGRVELDRIRISSAFPFGVVVRSVTFSQPGQLVVYPQIWRVRRELLREVSAVGPTGTRSAEKGGGHEEFFGLREYREGDSLKLVDWKHTARLGHMVSREMTQPSPPRLMLMLNLSGGESAGEAACERAISLTASLLCEAQFVGYEVGLTVTGAACPQFEVRPGRWHRDRMLRALGELELGSAEPAAQAGAPWRDAQWLVIHAGPIDRRRGPSEAAHLSEEDAERWRLGPPGRRSEGSRRNRAPALGRAAAAEETS